MNERICWRTPASSGSNQSSPSNGTAASSPVVFSMAWSPAAVVRPPVVGCPTLRRLRRPPISYQLGDTTRCDRRRIVLLSSAERVGQAAPGIKIVGCFVGPDSDQVRQHLCPEAL